MGERCNEGDILAGGTGSRLYPVTTVVTEKKQLLPVFDKPMIMSSTRDARAGIKDIPSSTADDRHLFRQLARRRQRVRPRHFLCGAGAAAGLADAFIVGRDFVRDSVSLILGDNIFYELDSATS